MLIKSIRDVLKMEQVKNDISAADSSSALVADFSATSSSKQILKMACSIITNIDSRIVNNIWLNEKAKGKQWKIAPNSSYVTLDSTRAPKQYEHTRAIIRKYVERNHPQNCSMANCGA
jgi:hypothetical protein